MGTTAALVAVVALAGCGGAVHRAAPPTTPPVAAAPVFAPTSAPTTSATPPVPVGNVAPEDPGVHSAPGGAQQTAAAFAVCWFRDDRPTSRPGHDACRDQATARLAADWDSVDVGATAADRSGGDEPAGVTVTSVVAEDVTAGSVGFSVTVSIDAPTGAGGPPAAAVPGFIALRVVETVAGWRVDQVTLP